MSIHEPMFEYHHLLKLLIIGNSGVGKSSILMRYSDNSFREQFIYTIGVDFKVRTLIIDGKIVRLQIWDTAGQERFRAFTTSYYRGAHGIVMVYDITDRSSFVAIANWLRDIERFGNNKNMTILLIGNKCDATDKRCVTFKEAQQFADEVGVLFLECSAKEGTNIESAFLLVATKVMLTQSKNLVEEYGFRRYNSIVDIEITNNSDSCAKRCCLV